MTLLEIVDRLCEVVKAQAEIIKDQAELVEQADIANAAKDELRSRRRAVDAEIDRLDLASRRYPGSD